MLTDFQNSFTGRLTGKFATKSYLTIPSYLKYVATLPCEIWMPENWQQSEICIVINDKSQDSTGKHLSYDGLLHYKFVIHCAGERIYQNPWTFGEVTGKMVDRVIRPIRLKSFVLKDAELAG